MPPPASPGGPVSERTSSTSAPSTPTGRSSATASRFGRRRSIVLGYSASSPATVTDVTIDDADLLALADLEPADLTGPAPFERRSGPGETTPAEADDDQREGRSGS